MACTVMETETLKTIVIKVGSAVLTDDYGLNRQVIGSLGAQLVQLLKVAGRRIVLVSSGAVAAGRAELRAGGHTHADQGLSRHGLAAIGQRMLMDAWNAVFAAFGLVTAQILLTREDLRSRKRFQVAGQTFSDLFAWRVLPIVNENDTVTVSELRFGDNDFLASLLVNLVEADLFVSLTSAPGVYEADPGANPDAALLHEIPLISALNIGELCGEKTALGSGGMYSKLLAARRVAQLGVPTLILPGREPDILLRAFSGTEKLGTWVWGDERTIPRRKFWLAYQSDPAGLVEVDDGAADALLHEGRSLLPGGVHRVEGDFSAGALVRVVHNGHNLAVGFCNYDAETLRQICGRKRHEIAAALGQAKYPDVIHRDNLVLDAAI